MNEQSMTPNPGGAAEAADRVRPDAMPAPVEHRPAPEMTPSPGATPAPVPAQMRAGGLPANLPADDPTGAQASADASGAPVPGAVTPAAAGDVDVIEPEWVDRAENVVRAHQGDPYGEEEAIEELQEEYLQKRYGFTVADPNGGNSKSGSA